MSDIRVVYITCGNRDEALDLGRMLVERRFAACANILAPITAVYRDKDAIETADEVVLIVKTVADNMEALTDTVKAHHSYSVPCVLSIPVKADEGNPDYLDWLRAETSLT